MSRNKHTYTIPQLIEAVKTSFSIRECIQKLGLVATGDAYRVIKRAFAEHNLDTSHFRGRGWLKGRSHKFNKTISLNAILDGDHPSYQSYKLKNRLIKENIFTHECQQCHLAEWLDGPIPLELDHIDGNPGNHILANLRLLCPNCHALTETHAGKNKFKNLVDTVGFEPT